MSYLGNIAEDATIRFRFNTNDSDGAPITLAGTPAISVYKDGSDTQSTAGVTLNVDHDSLTGHHLVTIDTSADAFYATGSDYTVVITTGTVDGTSVVGAVIGSFSIVNRTIIAASVTGAVGSVTGNVGGNVTGSVGSVVGAVGSVTGAVGSVTGDVGGKVLGGGSGTITGVGASVTVSFDGQISSSVDDAAATTTSFIGAAGLSASNDFYNGAVLAITSGTLKGIARRISDYTGSTRTFTFNTAFPAAPANGVTFIILGRIE